MDRAEMGLLVSWDMIMAAINQFFDVKTITEVVEAARFAKQTSVAVCASPFPTSSFPIFTRINKVLPIVVKNIS